MAYTEHFSIANLPYGIASSKTHPEKAVATRLEDVVIFLADLDLQCSDHVKSALQQVRRAMSFRGKAPMLM